jgi:WD40 repeat protein
VAAGVGGSVAAVLLVVLAIWLLGGRGQSGPPLAKNEDTSPRPKGVKQPTTPRDKEKGPQTRKHDEQPPPRDKIGKKPPDKGVIPPAKEIVGPPDKGKAIRRFGPPLPVDVRAVALSSDGRRLVAVCDNGVFCLYDVPREERLLEMRHDKFGQSALALISSDGTRLVSGGLDEAAHQWDLGLQKETAVWKIGGPVLSAAVSPDGRKAVFGTRQKLLLCDLESGQVIREDPKLPDVHAVRFTPKGDRIVAAGPKEIVRIVETASGQIIKELDGPWGSRSVAVSPDGKYFVAGGGHGEIFQWDLTTYQKVRAIQAFQGTVSSLDFSPDGTRLLASGLKDLRTWDAASGKDGPAQKDHQPFIWQALFSRDGRHVFSAGLKEGDSGLFLWRLPGADAKVAGQQGR